MLNQFSRTQLLLGRRAMEALAASRVAVFGIGGVGGHVIDDCRRGHKGPDKKLSTGGITHGDGQESKKLSDHDKMKGVNGT